MEQRDRTVLPLRDAIAEIVGSYPVDHYEAADDIIALLAPIGCSKCDADGVCSIAYCAEHDPRNAEQSKDSPHLCEVCSEGRASLCDRCHTEELRRGVTLQALHEVSD